MAIIKYITNKEVSKLMLDKLLKEFEQDFFRIKNSNIYKQAIELKEFKTSIEVGKGLSHTNIFVSDVDMTYIAVHTRKFITQKDIISIPYIKNNIIDKLLPIYKEEIDKFYEIYNAFYGFLNHELQFSLVLKRKEEKDYYIKTHKAVFDLLWYGDIIHRKKGWKGEVISFLKREVYEGTSYLSNLFGALKWFVYYIELILELLKNLYKKMKKGNERSENKKSVGLLR